MRILVAPVAGAIYISRGMKEQTNEGLKDLDLGYNEVKDEGACAIAQVRAGRHSLAGSFVRAPSCRSAVKNRPCVQGPRPAF